MERKKFSACLELTFQHLKYSVFIWWSSKSRERGDKDRDTPVSLNGLVKVAKFPLV
jgi:hypothetical protein